MLYIRSKEGWAVTNATMWEYVPGVPIWVFFGVVFVPHYDTIEKQLVEYLMTPVLAQLFIMAF